MEGYLDSARQATYLPVHARHFSIQKESISPYRSGNDYYWRLPAKGFAIRVYLRTIIAPGDTLYLHDANGMIIEKRYHQNHRGNLWASTCNPEEVSLRYRVPFRPGAPTTK
ncbi:MAG: hypothetical protein U5L96_02650 [Owenweeksia sp.]|nr:hypothetical protein [Owenweeksia sp.]